VVETLWFQFWTTISFSNLLLFRTSLADWSGIDSQYITYTIWILVLDALVIIPFSKLRYQKPMIYAAIKVVTSWLTLFWVLFFYYPNVNRNKSKFALFMWITSKLVIYSWLILLQWFIDFVALRLCLLELENDTDLWKRMMRYGMPIMVAGIAFAYQRTVRKILCQILPLTLLNQR
jgi:hypothetical protein